MSFDEERKKELRVLNEYYDSFVDDDYELIMNDASIIITIIQRIRKYNRKLAYDDRYNEKLVDEFNKKAHILIEFINNNKSKNQNYYDNSQSKYKLKKDLYYGLDSKKIHRKKSVKNYDKYNYEGKIDTGEQIGTDVDYKFNYYYADKLEFDNWFNYYPQLIEFISKSKITNKMQLLRKSIRKNAEAFESIKYIDDFDMALEKLEKKYEMPQSEKDKLVIELIEKFEFDEANEGNSFRELLIIALQIIYNLHYDYKIQHLNVLIKKLPSDLHLENSSPKSFLRVIRSKIRTLDCRIIFGSETIDELEKFYGRITNDKKSCPICYELEKSIRSHSIIRCRFLSKFLTKFKENYYRNVKLSNNRSIITEQNEKNMKDDLALNEQPNRKRFYISFVDPKIRKCSASIIDDSTLNYDAIIEEETFKSLSVNCEQNTENFDSFDCMSNNGNVIGQIKLKLAIGFIIRDVKFTVINDKELKKDPLQISEQVLKQFSLDTSMNQFKQYFSRIKQFSVDTDGEADENSDENVNQIKVVAINGLFEKKCRPLFGKNKSNKNEENIIGKLSKQNIIIESKSYANLMAPMKIVLKGINYDNDYYINNDYEFYSDLTEDQKGELKEMSAKINIYAFRVMNLEAKDGETQTDNQDDDNDDDGKRFDSILIEFYEQKKFILIDDQYDEIIELKNFFQK